MPKGIAPRRSLYGRPTRPSTPATIYAAGTPDPYDGRPPRYRVLCASLVLFQESGANGRSCNQHRRFRVLHVHRQSIKRRPSAKAEDLRFLTCDRQTANNTARYSRGRQFAICRSLGKFAAQRGLLSPNAREKLPSDKRGVSRIAGKLHLKNSILHDGAMKQKRKDEDH